MRNNELLLMLLKFQVDCFTQDTTAPFSKAEMEKENITETLFNIVFTINNLERHQTVVEEKTSNQSQSPRVSL